VTPMADIDLADARWFPVDLHVGARCYGMLRLDEDVLTRSSFLDTRMDAPLADATPLPVAAVPPTLATAPVGWLFHTSFCGSTLAARALHLPPYATCLREPLVLRRLGDARYSDLSLEGVVEPTVRLLSRPWHPHGAVVIKPTHAALNVARELMHAAPRSRGAVITSSLDDFLVSNLKKTAETQSKIPQLIERALRAAPSFAARLPSAALQPPDLACAAALQWAAQRERVLDIRDAVGPARLRVLDMQDLLQDLPRAAAALADWFGIAVPDDALRAHCADVASRNAKATEVAYGAARRASEMATVARMYAGALDRARRWADTHVLPAMRPPALTPPAPWAWPEGAPSKANA